MEPLKNMFNMQFVEQVSTYIYMHEKTFLKDKYEKKVSKNLESLELKDRMRLISSLIHEHLPLSYKEQIEVLKKAKSEFTIYENFQLTSMIFPDFVELYGLDDYETSIGALEFFTIDSSSEFAIRQFILRYEDNCMNQMKTWAKSENEHIRRLASEGCRPRLPWSIALPKFKDEPSKVLEVIEILKFDKSKYVQKSVANNLNDISKDNPKLVIDFVSNNLGLSKELDWICKHASRTLLKKGDKKILELFGFVGSSHVDIIDFMYDKSLNIGDDLNFSFEVQSEKNIGNVRIEYVIDYLKSNNSHSSKVFMINQNEIKSKKKNFKKKQSFKNMTTRKHYVGEHFISILLNGEEKLRRSFILNDTSN